MLLEKMPDLQEILFKIRTPSDVHKVIDSMDYSCPEPYRIRSAKTTLESGKGHCVECALAAGLLMEKLNFPFRAVALIIKREFHVAQSIYVYNTKKGYFSLAKSRIPEFVSRSTPFPNVESLVKSYIPCINQEGFELIMHSELNESFFSFDWRYSPDYMDNFERHLRKVLCKRYKEHFSKSRV